MLDMSRRCFLYGAAASVTQLSFTFDTSPNPILPKAEWRPPFMDRVGDEFDFSDYDLTRYREDIQTFGLSKCWERICRWMLEHGESEFLNIQSIGQLYEEGLAVQDKFDKKHNGQYYTPGDVANVMSEWLERLPGEDVCDVGCGVGNLILSYLDRLGKEKAVHIAQYKALGNAIPPVLSWHMMKSVCEAFARRRMGCSFGLSDFRLSERRHSIV